MRRNEQLADAIGEFLKCVRSYFSAEDARRWWFIPFSPAAASQGLSARANAEAEVLMAEYRVDWPADQPKPRRVPSAAEVQRLNDLGRRCGDARNDVVRRGTLLAEELERAGFDSSPVLDVVARADRGGGVPAVRQVWLKTKVELQRLALRLRAADPTQDCDHNPMKPCDAATGVLTRNPTLSMRQIAQRVGCDVSTLSRSKEFRPIWDTFQRLNEDEARERAKRNARRESGESAQQP